MRKITYVAWLYVAAGCFLMIGGIGLYENCQFWFNSDYGFMESSDPAISRAVKYGSANDIVTASVTYVTKNGTQQVPNKWLNRKEVEQLNAGYQIPIRFLKNDPQRVLRRGEKLDSPWGWLVCGLFVLAVSIYAHRLLRKELQSDGMHGDA